jgi:hypothetical protein
LLHAGPASTPALNFVSPSGLQHASEASASNIAASNSYAERVGISKDIDKATIIANFQQIDVLLPSAQKELANKSISPSVTLVPNHFNSNLSSNPALTGSSARELSTNLASQYPHLNENNMFQELPPTADAGPAQVVNSGSTVVLNGSNSKAENGKIVSFSWEQVPTNAKITLSGVNSPVWEFIAPPVSGDTILRFQLTVTDNLGQMGHDTVNILDKPNTLQINPRIESIPTLSKNSSLLSNEDANTVVIPSNARSGSSSLPTATSTFPPPLTPPITSTGHR